jgi:hypothetical protein
MPPKGHKMPEWWKARQRSLNAFKRVIASMDFSVGTWWSDAKIRLSCRRAYESGYDDALAWMREVMRRHEYGSLR